MVHTRLTTMRTKKYKLPRNQDYDTNTKKGYNEETSGIATTTPSNTKRTEDSCGTLEVPKIIIIKYCYQTPEKEPFELPENLQVSPTHLTWTPDLDAWFDND